MTLAALIRKRKSGKVATAILAISATQQGGQAGTVATIATVAVANPTETKTALMTAEEEKAIRAWLAHIEESDPEIIAEVLEKCKRDSGARAYFMWRAEEVPKPDIWPCVVHCGDCTHFERIDHPHLGHCAEGEREAIAGLWDTDQRSCSQWHLLSHKPGE